VLRRITLACLVLIMLSAGNEFAQTTKTAKIKPPKKAHVQKPKKPPKKLPTVLTPNEKAIRKANDKRIRALKKGAQKNRKKH
jgi:hypothetical protein